MPIKNMLQRVEKCGIADFVNKIICLLLGDFL